MNNKTFSRIKFSWSSVSPVKCILTYTTSTKFFAGYAKTAKILGYTVYVCFSVHSHICPPSLWLVQSLYHHVHVCLHVSLSADVNVHVCQLSHTPSSPLSLSLSLSVCKCTLTLAGFSERNGS